MTTLILIDVAVSTSITQTRACTEQERLNLLIILHPIRYWATTFAPWLPNPMATSHKRVLAIKTLAELCECSAFAGGGFSFQLGLGVLI